MKHNFYTAADISPDDEWAQRNIVDGGLAICKACGGSEGSLTTDCPGKTIPYELDQLVYKGERDFIEGQGWVPQASKHSPEYWRTRRAKYQGGLKNDCKMFKP